MIPALMMRRLMTALVVLAVLWAPLVGAVTPPGWKDSGFSINASGMSLRKVLDEFGRVYGVGVSYHLKTEKYLNGRLKAASGAEFLDRLTQPYKFRWFVYNETLYVVPQDDNASYRLELGEDAVVDAKAALTGLGLFDARFGWGEMPDEGVVIVSGPRVYIDLVREVLMPEEAKLPPKGKHVMVFWLKYATAADRMINTRGETETIPGIKTILSNLLFGPESKEKLADISQFDIGSHKRSRGPASRRGSARELRDDSSFATLKRAGNEGNDDKPRQPGTIARDDRPRIEADPTINAIVIYDDVKKRDMYRQLIAELDIEPQQIEIEALIVDIDRTKLAEIGVEWGGSNDVPKQDAMDGTDGPRLVAAATGAGACSEIHLNPTIADLPDNPEDSDNPSRITRQ